MPGENVLDLFGGSGSTLVAAEPTKVARAMPATAALEGGRVLLPASASWVRDFIDEVLAFPVGAHDDQVDVLSYAVEVLNGRSWRPSLFFGDAKRGERDDDDDDDDDDREPHWMDGLAPRGARDRDGWRQLAELPRGITFGNEGRA